MLQSALKTLNSKQSVLSSSFGNIDIVLVREVNGVKVFLTCDSDLFPKHFNLSTQLNRVHLVSGTQPC